MDSSTLRSKCGYLMPMTSSLLPVLVLFSCSVMAEQGSAKKSRAPVSAASKSEAAPSAKDDIKEGPSSKSEPRIAAVSSIEPEALEGFDHYAPQVQQLVRDALALTKLNLTYTFGSSSPKQGGMDCSGTLFYLLNGLGLKGVPRQSNEICAWVQSHTLLHRVEKADSLKHPEFASLQPGDLLFWSGTYVTAPRTLPVTHVMLYLGKLKKSGRPLVFGASDGRVYQGERRTGVSVFDLSLPKESSPSKFYGYGLIPGVGKIVPRAPEPVIVEAAPTPAPAVTLTVVDLPETSPPESEETVKKAIVPSEAISPTQPVKKAPSKASSGSASKSKSPASGTQAKPKSTQPATSPKKSPPKPRTAPATTTNTVQDKLRQTANDVGNSIRAFISP